MQIVKVGNYEVGQGHPLMLMAGPCVLEGYERSLMIGQRTKAICDKLGYELKIEDMAFETILASVNSGKADFGAAGMTVTDERKESVDFTDTYANASQVVIVRK